MVAGEVLIYIGRIFHLLGLGMLKVYVLITLDKGFSKTTTERLAKIQGVKTVDVLYGVYDICVIIEAKNMGQLEKTVISKIRRVEGVANTLTLIVARSTIS
jgi:DNA-binding Lrp family transcriptional regulator